MSSGSWMDDYEVLEAPVGRFKNASDAMVYLAMALEHSGVDLESNDVRQVPPALQKFETEVDPLTPEELHYVIQTFIQRLEARVGNLRAEAREQRENAWLN